LNREKSKMTLMQLKSAIGDLCTDAYLSKLENDKNANKKGQPTRPDKEIVTALAEVFKEDVEYALWLADYAAPTFIKQQQPSFIHQIDWQALSPSDLAEIESFIQFKIQTAQDKPQALNNAEYVGRHQPDKSIVVENHRKLTDEEADRILDALEDDEPSLEFSEEQIIALLSAHQRRTAQKK
jgi:transcriptional regulator with XRE-family HTH domain